MRSGRMVRSVRCLGFSEEAISQMKKTTNNITAGPCPYPFFAGINSVDVVSADVHLSLSLLLEATCLTTSIRHPGWPPDPEPPKCMDA